MKQKPEINAVMYWEMMHSVQDSVDRLSGRVGLLEQKVGKLEYTQPVFIKSADKPTPPCFANPLTGRQHAVIEAAKDAAASLNEVVERGDHSRWISLLLRAVDDLLASEKPYRVESYLLDYRICWWPSQAGAKVMVATATDSQWAHYTCDALNAYNPARKP